MSLIYEDNYCTLFQELKWRSPPLEKEQKVKLVEKPLTEEELDFLNFFVDYCSHTDDIREFGLRSPKIQEETEIEEEDK